MSAGGELNFWNERGAAWHQAGPAGTEAPFLGQAAADYLGVLRAIGPKSARVTDKMPFNFLWAGLIHLAFPRATIIHCRRAAIDTALSIHQTLFHPGLAFPTGGAKLVAYFRSYQRLTDHWRRVLPADRFIEVEYEDLTREPEPVIRRIIAGCGLAWDDACLRPERNPRAVKTPSKWQTRQPIYRDSVERWRRYEPWLGPLRALLDGVSRRHRSHSSASGHQMSLRLGPCAMTATAPMSVAVNRPVSANGDSLPLTDTVNLIKISRVGGHAPKHVYADPKCLEYKISKGDLD